MQASKDTHTLTHAHLHTDWRAPERHEDSTTRTDLILFGYPTLAYLLSLHSQVTSSWRASGAQLPPIPPDIGLEGAEPYQTSAYLPPWCND